ncbi:cytochrome P450 [Epithele typhae]|uniref:cytochrome P450 n=1 Tax=Epithele typhae TaxID=378194 RepID=UPI00200845E4|nr:cytochrome P450 [Epithele typhae]KAH9937810.1 cytochrome P450 [Epithele typhae]
MAPSVTAISLVLAALVLVALRRKKRTSNLPLPPGPPPLPLIGNALDMPKVGKPVAFRDLCAKYGDIVHLEIFGKPMIVLGSHEAAMDLFEKRSANYSDRTKNPMIDIAGFAWAMPVQPYGPWWRRHRRAVHQYFNANAVAKYAAFQKLESHRLVRRLIENPQDFLKHIRRYFGSSIMRVTYGIEVDDDPVDYLTMAGDVMTIVAVVFNPGRYLVEVLPWLRHVPTWMPGAAFKRDGVMWTEMANKLITIPWKATVAAVRAGVARPSMAAELIERSEMKPDADPEEEDEINRNSAAVAYAAGADTTLSTVETFFLAMTMYPEVQKRAHVELMSVVGPHRLPEKEDEPSLHYIQALAKECLRWRPVVPLGIPHRSLQDDEYKGYFIPAGSLVFANVWAYLQDEKVYPEPDRFMPERFLKDGRLDPTVRDPATIAFGYGRRICPGMHFAETSLFMVVATVLHTLNISAPLGADGKPIEASGKMSDGLLAYPEPFGCAIQSASAETEALIRASCIEPSSLTIS